jgi:hypothetical protein
MLKIISQGAIFECRDTHYREDHSESDRTSCDTSDNACQDIKNPHYSFYR